ncbi:MAG: hypothetical protein GYA87_10395 [Christensenellaceae bacterium]|nr:hypothetical protein [Christensenellaceae bacterium]
MKRKLNKKEKYLLKQQIKQREENKIIQEKEYEKEIDEFTIDKIKSDVLSKEKILAIAKEYSRTNSYYDGVPPCISSLNEKELDELSVLSEDINKLILSMIPKNERPKFEGKRKRNK